MRDLSDSERAAMQTPLREYWVKKDGLLPKETRAFEAGFIAGLEYLQAERDGLAVDVVAQRGQNAKLRAALKQIADGNPAPLGGKWLSDAKMAQIARSILSNVEAAS